jgi:hypothetical protein
MIMEAEMSNYSLLLDVAKVRQADVAREVEFARIKRELKLNRKAIRTAKKQRISTASIS